MQIESNRPRRVAGLLQKELAPLIQQELSDPRVKDITLTTIEMSRDLSRARVFITSLAGADAAEKAVKVLNKATPYLRKQLKGRLELRGIPNLRFVYDESVERGANLSALIDRAREDDQDKNDEEN